MILCTERLMLRRLNEQDFKSLCAILQDAEVMYAYEHAFSDAEVYDWLNKQLNRYKVEGIGLWAVILKESGEFIGQCGLTLQECNNETAVEVGYLFNKKFWNKGYATEAAIACKEYAFKNLDTNSVCSIIRDNNIASQKVALRNGMTAGISFVKKYYGMDMPHIVYSISREEFEKQKKGSAIL